MNDNKISTMKKISVVVPIYNMEKYLDICIQSIINQSYKDIEIILINDGSKDESLNICNKYSIKDKRIIVLNQKNSGVSASRKAGIKIATGDYLTFVDADDYIDLNMYKDMIKIVEENNADIAECGYTFVSEHGEILSRYLLKDEIIIGHDSCVKKFLDSDNSTVFLWNKIYKKSLFDNIEFDEYSYSEDYLWNIYLMAKCNKKVTCSNAYYNYSKIFTGACNVQINNKRLDGVFAAEQAYDFLLNNFPEYADYSIKYILQYILTIYKMYFKQNTGKNNNFIFNLKDLFKKHCAKKSLRKICTTTNLVAFGLFRISPRLFYYCDKLYQKF